jgi:hypothetical protein
MPKPLEELHAQRALVKQHLEWLDRQIKAATHTTSGTACTDSAESRPNQPAATTQPQPSPASAAVATETPIDAIKDEPPLAAATSDLVRAKIGCLAIFGFATTLFLFFLFGLPYLID